jgi:tetratricopeptide (TPR) repeat protein
MNKSIQTFTPTQFHVWTFVLFFCCGLLASAESVQVQILQQKGNLQLQFQGIKEWDYDLEKQTQGKKVIYRLLVPSLQADSSQALQQLKHDYFSSIRIQPKAEDEKTAIYFEVTSSGLDAFDYLTDQPSRLIIDFYSKDGSPTKVKAQNEKESTSTAKKPQEERVTKKGSAAERTPASTDIMMIAKDGFEKNSGSTSGLQLEGIDPMLERFSMKKYQIKESSIIQSRENVYVEFPMLKQPLPYLQNILTQPPVYQVLPEDNDENKMARLLETLFEKKRYGVFLKTSGWFRQKYPQSKYMEIVDAMTGDIYYNQWLEKKSTDDLDKSILKFRQFVEKYPQSPLSARTSMLIGFTLLDRSDILGSIRFFQDYIQKNPNSAQISMCRFALAEAYLKLNRFQEAQDEYEKISKQARDEKDRVQAQFSMGEVYLKKHDYTKAIESYKTTLKNLKNFEMSYPNAFYNIATAEFGMQKYENALEAYKEFIKKFPSHPYASYAMTRIGEILQILGAPSEQVLGAYLETGFRYGDTPGSSVARIRLMSQKMKNMKEVEVQHSVAEIQKLAKASDLPKIDQFSTLMVAEGYTHRESYSKSIDLLVEYYQAHPTTVDAPLFQNRIVKNIHAKILKEVKSGQYLEAMKTHNQYAGNWLKNNPRIDTKFLIAQSFEQAGQMKQADLLYRDTLNRIYALKGTPQEKEVRILESVPTTEEVNLRLAAVSYQSSNFGKAYDFLREIKNPETLSETEQIERVQLASSLLEKKSDYETATRYLTELLKTWKGLPELLANPYFDLGQMEEKQSHLEKAVEAYSQVLTLKKDTEKVSADLHAKSLEKLAQLYLKKGQVDKSIQSYTELLETYEKDKKLASARYKLGQIYFDKGQLQKAKDTWALLEGQQNNFWYKMAQDQIRNQEWMSDYKKYSQRIPAMVNDKKDESSKNNNGGNQ